MISNKNIVPVPTIHRLPLYLSFLKSIKTLEVKHISAPEIAKVLHIDSTQITKDFSYLNISGKTKIGYETINLIKVIEDFLGYHIKRKAFIVGVGNLGLAILKYDEFAIEGMEIIAGFDLAFKKANTEENNIKIYNVDEFANRAKITPVDIGIIAVPAQEAQKVADLMVNSSIRAIWNFSARPVSAPDYVIIENTSIDAGLAMIKWKLNKNKPLIYKNRIL